MHQPESGLRCYMSPQPRSSPGLLELLWGVPGALLCSKPICSSSLLIFCFISQQLQESLHLGGDEAPFPWPCSPPPWPLQLTFVVYFYLYLITQVVHDYKSYRKKM